MIINYVRPILEGLVQRIRYSADAGERGQALAEYGMVIGLVAVICIAAVTAIGLAILGRLDVIGSALGGGGS